MTATRKRPARQRAPSAARPAQPPFADPRVRAMFDGYPAAVRGDLLRLRALILETAADLELAGGLVETIKWSQPAYLPAKPRVGTTLRLDARRGATPGFALYVHCQTTLADDIRTRYPDLFRFEGNRALLFTAGEPLPTEPLRHAIGLALTYHSRRG